jgi:hypothetical protein
VTRHRRLLAIVEPGAAQPRVGEREAERLDEIDADPEARGQAQNRPRVLRDVGLEQGDAQIGAQRARDRGRKRDASQSTERGY